MAAADIRSPFVYSSGRINLQRLNTSAEQERYGMFTPSGSAANSLLLKEHTLTALPTAAAEKQFTDLTGIRGSSAITHSVATTVTGERDNRRLPLAERQVNWLPSEYPPDPEHATTEGAALPSAWIPSTHYMASDVKAAASEANYTISIGYDEDDSIYGGVSLSEETPTNNFIAPEGNTKLSSLPFKDECIEYASINHNTPSNSFELPQGAMTGSETEGLNFEPTTILRDPRRNGVDFSSIIESGDYDFLRTTTETCGTSEDKVFEVSTNFGKPVPRTKCLPISPRIVVTEPPSSPQPCNNLPPSNRRAAKASELDSDSVWKRKCLSVHSQQPVLSLSVSKPDKINVYVDAHGQHLPVFPVEKQHSEVKSNHSVRSKLASIKERARLRSQSVVYPIKMVSKYVFYRAMDGAKNTYCDPKDSTEATTHLAPTNSIEKPKRSVSIP
jgi:hypothetical protein